MTIQEEFILKISTKNTMCYVIDNALRSEHKYDQEWDAINIKNNTQERKRIIS